MGTILPFVKPDSAFDPKDITAMSMALDDVCKTLNLRDVPEREIIAERIFNLALEGVRSPTVLRDRVLHEAGLADRIGLDGRDEMTADLAR